MKNVGIAFIVLFSIFLSPLLCCSSFAQSDSTIVTINNIDYSVNELNYLYSKNSIIEEKSNSDYIDMFIEYKLKVNEALSQKLDTLPSFKKELEQLTAEASEPYLMANVITDSLVMQTYERSRYEIAASHILIRIDFNHATPQDTLKAYKLILGLKKQIDEGADFESLAKEYSQDPSAKKNGGYLGYFSAFQMVYPFEDAAYSTPVGSVSGIVKTQFGYHLIFVKNKRKVRDKVLTAQIMFKVPSNAPADVQRKKYAKADSVRKLIIEGADFSAVARKYSEDPYSSKNNGKLPWAGNNLPPQYYSAALKLNNVGDISPIVQTSSGFHIIKLLGKQPFPSYNSIKNSLRQRVLRSGRASKPLSELIYSLKEAYNFKYDSVKINELNSAFSANYNQGQEGYKRNIKLLLNDSTTLFTIDNKDYMVADFGKYLTDRQLLIKTNDELNAVYDVFERKCLFDKERSLLPQKYPEYNYIINEYRDGLLIFAVLDKEVWSKTQNDTVALRKYFTDNIDDYNIPPTFEGAFVLFKTSKEAKQFKRAISKVDKRGDAYTVDEDMVSGMLNSVGETFEIHNGKYTQGEISCVDEELWGTSSDKSVVGNYKYCVVIKGGKLTDPIRRKYDQVKSMVVDDYQNYYSKKWLDSLREKFSPIIVNKKNMNLINIEHEN